MAKRLLTTGEVAEICSVARDTVFKWIRAGYLPAARTAGGHHRVDRSDLDQFLAHSETPKREVPQVGSPESPQYCWQHHGEGKVLEGCKRCGVYLMRAQRCYEWFRAVGSAGQPGIYCEVNCPECDYYQSVHGQQTNVLVLTNDPELSRAILEADEEGGFNIRVADCGYECSVLVDEFRPDYVIIDTGLQSEEVQTIAQHLMRDPRLPFVRVVVAGESADFEFECEEGFFGQMKRPISVQDIKKFVAPRESFPESDIQEDLELQEDQQGLSSTLD
jgi:excisionase family DNA binding protein